MRRSRFIIPLLLIMLLSGCFLNTDRTREKIMPQTPKTKAAAKLPPMTRPAVTESKDTDTDMDTYTFTACDPSLLPQSRAWLCGVYEFGSAEEQSLFIGQAITLFGEPDYTSDDNEDLFSKAVCAEDRDGNKLYLEVYFGPSGPAIGGEYSGDRAEASEKAANELAKLIMAAEPTDYAWESVYGDVGITIKMGVKDGVPYYDEVFPEGFGF